MFTVFENGITSFNFPIQQNLMNSRASRTTHPRTIACLQNIFNVISEDSESEFLINTPYINKTKADIFRVLADTGYKNLISSAVSCSNTFFNGESATHCGCCSQCIDRRFAAYASEMDDYDESGIYAFDFIKDEIENQEVWSMLLDYYRMTKSFTEWNFISFSQNMLIHLVDIIDYVSGSSEEEKAREIWNLCQKHGKEVEAASRRIRNIYDDNIFRELPDKSFMKMITERKFLNDSNEKEQLSNKINSNLSPNGKRIFYSYSCKDEEFRIQLQNHLTNLRREGVITEWHFREISAGKEWEGEIDRNLNSADVILLLISSDFLASDYCYDVEMTRAMQRHNAEEACVIPIILRPVEWEKTPFRKLQALPKDGKPVTRWKDQDEAFLNIAKGIRKAIEDLGQTENNR